MSRWNVRVPVNDGHPVELEAHTKGIPTVELADTMRKVGNDVLHHYRVLAQARARRAPWTASTEDYLDAFAEVAHPLMVASTSGLKPVVLWSYKLGRPRAVECTFEEGYLVWRPLDGDWGVAAYVPGNQEPALPDWAISEE